MSDRVDDLIDAYVDDTIDEAGMAALDALMVADAAVARRVALQLDLHQELRNRLRPSSRILPAIGKAEASAPSAKSSRRMSVRTRRRRTSSSPGRWMVAVLAVAACVVAGVFLGRSPKPISWIEGRATVSGGSGIADAARIRPGSRIAAIDRTAICFSDGSRIDLRTGSVAEVLEGPGKRIELVDGTLTAQVARQDPQSPMIITTDHAEMTVVGTVFAVTKDEAGTRLAVEHGSVRMRGGDVDRVVSAGQEQSVRRPDAPLPQRGSDETLIALGSIWSYHCGDLPSKSALLPGFDATSWGRGPAPLGFDTNEHRDIFATIIDGAVKPGSSVDLVNTVWFRQEFICDNPETIAYASIQFQRDDGAVIYLNGREIYRDNMPEGHITADTRAIQKDGEKINETFHSAEIPVDALRPGRNCLMAEVHQYAAVSTDVLFSCVLTVRRTSGASGGGP